MKPRFVREVNMVLRTIQIVTLQLSDRRAGWYWGVVSDTYRQLRNIDRRMYQLRHIDHHDS